MPDDKSCKDNSEETITIYKAKRAQAEKMIAAYKKDRCEPVQHIVDLNRVVLAWFMEYREDVMRAATDKNRPELVKEFDDYHAYLRDYIDGIKEPGQLTIRALSPIKKYDLDNIVRGINDREILEKAGEYSSVLYSFDPRKTSSEHYDTTVEKLNRIRDTFVAKRDAADEQTRGALEECVKRVGAMSLRVRINKCRKVDMDEDPKKAKSYMEELIREAEKYQKEFPELVDFAKRVKAHIENYVTVLGMVTPIPPAAEKPGQ